MMRKSTVAKIAAFRAATKVGQTMNHFNYPKSEDFPCWTTLKKYNVIERTGKGVLVFRESFGGADDEIVPEYRVTEA